MMKRSTIVWLAGLGIAIVPTAAALAHPHAWIDFEATVRFDDGRHVTGLEVNWLFDDFYTAFIVDGFEKDGIDQQQGLLELASINLNNLREYDYFADLKADGQALELDDVETFETGVEDGRLWLKFTLQLAERVDPEGQQFSYSFYDPTYYVEVLHAEGSQPAVAGRDDCSVRILPPNPTPEMVALAYSLDQDAEAPDTLGAMFAETAVLACD
jgi:ABC-type uncharacterized transport system substrate-binding protein